jgi:hypothetical protein
MAFSDKLKLKVKQRAHFKGCIDQRPYVEVHHIVPQAEGGEDTEDNAAPLCPWCHELYGNDHTKRKFIKEARDHWYERCETKYNFDARKLDEITQRLNQAATKDDMEEIKNAVAKINDLLVQVVSQPNQTSREVVQTISDITATISTSAVLANFAHCGYCGLITYDQREIDSGLCPHCGKPFNTEWGT